MCEAHVSVMCFTEPYKAKKKLDFEKYLVKKTAWWLVVIMGFYLYIYY